MNRRVFLITTGLAAAGAWLAGHVEAEAETSIEVVGSSRHGLSFRAEDMGRIDYGPFQERIIINRVYTDEQGRTRFDITRNI